MKIKAEVDIVIHNTYQPHAGEKNADKKNKEYRKVKAIKDEEKRQ